MKFHMVIVLGNDAMKTAQDVVDAVRSVTDSVAFTSLSLGDIGHPIHDANGNVVGHWGFGE